MKWHTTKSFTPTRDFNADDVVFTFERQLDPNHPYHKVSGGTYEYFDSMDMRNLLKSVEKVDDHTVKFTLTAPQAPFLANLAMDFASIMSAEYADQMMKAGTPEKLDLEPVGTGPFQLVDYQKDAVIRYKANPDYWGGKADDRQSGVRDHARRLGALPEAQGRRVPGHGLPEPGRPAGDEGRTPTSTCCSRKA